MISVAIQIFQSSGKMAQLLSLVSAMACLADNFVHMSSNWLDVRYWIRIWVLLGLDTSLLIVSTVQGWDDDVGRIYLLVADAFALLSIILAIYFTHKFRVERARLRAEFDKHDENEDGYLTGKELRDLVIEHPVGGFNRFRRCYANVEDASGSTKTVLAADFLGVTLAKRAPRALIGMLAAEFVADWLSYLSSLILFRNGTVVTGVVVAQGIFSVFDLTAVVHHVASSYLSKYKVHGICCHCIIGCTYYSLMLAVFFAALSGFAITAVVADYTAKLSHRNSTSTSVRVVQAIDSPGFWAGWVLTGVLLITMIYIAILYYCFYQCGFVSFVGRSNTVLGKVEEKAPNKMKRMIKGGREIDEVEELFEYDSKWFVKRLHRNAQRITNNKMAKAINTTAKKGVVVFQETVSTTLQSHGFPNLPHALTSKATSSPKVG